jgi:hypothetical protein
VVQVEIADTQTTDSIKRLAVRVEADFRQRYGGEPSEHAVLAVEVPPGLANETVPGITRAISTAAGLLGRGIYLKLHGWPSPVRLCP